MKRRTKYRCCLIALALVCACWPGQNRDTEQAIKARLVEMIPFEFDVKNPERKQFGALTLTGSYQLKSKDGRFGGLSGLSIDAGGRLYAISDRGYWLSAQIVQNAESALTDMVDWQIAPMLTPAQVPVTGALTDAEALSHAQDGSLLVAFEGRHRIWRYDRPPRTFESAPTSIPVPAD
jgi:hypothetical protein